MEKISTIDVRQRIGDLLNRVSLRHDEFVIERKGKPLAALVPTERLEQMRRFARRHALELFEDWMRIAVSEEQALALPSTRRARPENGSASVRAGPSSAWSARPSTQTS